MEYRLLIVDDQRDLVTALRNQFFIKGYEVMSANDGTAAMDLVDRSAFDVILLDIEMPGPSGLEVLKHVKKRQPEAKIIVMTGHSDYESKARELGCDFFLTKPFIFGELERSVVALLNRKDYDELKSYSTHGQMTLAPKGASVADILLVEPIDILADAIAVFWGIQKRRVDIIVFTRWTVGNGP
jgi:DNA-binding response OmpR family regulator